MKLEVNTCYSHILWMQCSGELFTQAINKMEMGAPNFAHEGVNGYIDVKATFYIRDLSQFSRLWNSWYSLSDNKKLNLYGLAKGLGDCK